MTLPTPRTWALIALSVVVILALQWYFGGGTRV